MYLSLGLIEGDCDGYEESILVLIAAVVPVLILIALIAVVSGQPLLPPECPEGKSIKTGDTIRHIAPQCVGGFLGSPVIAGFLLMVGTTGAVIVWRRWGKREVQ